MTVNIFRSHSKVQNKKEFYMAKINLTLLVLHVINYKLKTCKILQIFFEVMIFRNGGNIRIN